MVVRGMEMRVSALDMGGLVSCSWLDKGKERWGGIVESW